MKLKSVFFILFAVACFSIKAQTNAKQHYEIISPTNTDISLYKKVLDNTYLDSLRFLHERRTIEFTNLSIKVVLYSAEELLTTYGKQVSEKTITRPYAARPVKFQLSENNQIQVIGQ
ncbi:MAG: hypothetical protein K0S33_4081 [Bacteroidetes bacterium]|jgi:hypothetical protein|nr:hypothetical protein [Bacteroidota bacterium]